MSKTHIGGTPTTVLVDADAHRCVRCGWIAGRSCAGRPRRVSGTCIPNPATCPFTDDPLVPGTTTIKSAHITELRACINVLRARFGRSPFTFTDPNLAGGIVKAVHILELRTALQGAYVAAGQPSPSYTDPGLTAHVTLIKVVHIQQLRAAVLALE